MPAKPVHEIRRGLIVVRIWMRSARQQTRYTTSALRLFRNGEAWKESSRFGPKDIPLLRLLLDEAHLWILRQRTLNRIRVPEPDQSLSTSAKIATATEHKKSCKARTRPGNDDREGEQ
ncbi:MAG: hypothetical protein KDB01_12540 [Planctomycetaceae bacterium]|nr:hypothetical protein [Planctomycetaceae bacterium]